MNELPLRFRLRQLALLLTPFVAVHTLAAQTNCSTAPSSFSCKLDRTLHTLEWLALILGIVLVIVAVIAFVAYRTNKRAQICSRNGPDV